MSDTQARGERTNLDRLSRQVMSNQEAERAAAELRRLRRERDALLTALADAIGVSETEAWRIARLDMEVDDE